MGEAHENRDAMTRQLAGDADSEHERIGANEFMTARSHLVSLSWCGLFEDVQSSAAQIERFWGLSDVAETIDAKPRLNTNFERPRDFRLSAIEKEIILKRNKWDSMLYDLAVVL